MMIDDAMDDVVSEIDVGGSLDGGKTLRASDGRIEGARSGGGGRFLLNFSGAS